MQFDAPTSFALNAIRSSLLLLSSPELHVVQIVVLVAFARSYQALASPARPRILAR